MVSTKSNIDTGHAWIILVAGIIIMCFEHAATTGIFYMAILEKYQRDHYATIWIQTLQTGTLYLTGLIAGIIIEKRGYRFTSLLGGIIYTISFLTSCFAPTLEVLYVSLGIGTGFSQGLLAVTVFAIIPHHFDEKLGMAVGFTQAGVGMGLFIFSALNGYLVATYGLQGTFLILTGVAANTIPLGMLMQKPPEPKEHAKTIECEKAKQDVGTERQSLLRDEEQAPSKSSNDIKTTEFEMHTKAQDNLNYNSNLDMTPERGNNFSCCDIASMFHTIGLDLFKNKYYTLLLVATLFISLPHNVVATILPDHIKWTGGTELQATSSLVIIGAGNTAGRLFSWKISKNKFNHSIYILTINSMLNGAGLACTLFLYEYWMYVILCVLYGITRGVYMIYHSLLLIQIVGKERSHHGFGVGMTMRGIVILIGMSSFGAITDATYNTWGYNVAFISLGSCEIVAGFILIALRILYRNAP